MHTPEDIIDVVERLDALADLPRTGWLLRGVSSPESIADHSFGVAVVAMLVTDVLRARGQTVDGERVLRMALVHDAPEARTGDMPMPQKTPALSRALTELEDAIVDGMLPPLQRDAWREAEAAQTLEARIVAAADKIQMMIKVRLYETRRGIALDNFWANPNNFRTMDLDVAEDIYRALCARAGRPMPR